MTTLTPPAVRRPKQVLRFLKKSLKRVVPLCLAIWFIPWAFAVAVAVGLLDVLRNRPFRLGTLDRYFAGNGVFTWLLAPFNLLMDLLTLPYRNRGIYRLDQLPVGHQAEIQELIDAAHRRDLIGQLQPLLGENKRGMLFFQWYGKILPTSVDMPEYQKRFKYIRTIGVSIFNKKQSTGRHYGPLRITLRVLYNINPVNSPDVYIEVGEQVHRWKDNPLFIFDDTLQHQSVNQADAERYCLFVDILRPSLMPWLMSGILTGVRWIVSPFRAVFYKHWTILR